MGKLRQGMSAKGFLKTINENAEILGTESKLSLGVRTPRQLKQVLNEQAGKTIATNKTLGGKQTYEDYENDYELKELDGLAQYYNKNVSDVLPEEPVESETPQEVPPEEPETPPDEDPNKDEENSENGNNENNESISNQQLGEEDSNENSSSIS